MTGWIIFGGILAGIAALCLTNIRLDAFYRNGEMGAEARWLFVRYRIWPRPEKKKKAVPPASSTAVEISTILVWRL